MKSIIFNQHQVNHALKNKEGMFRLVVGDSPFEKVEYCENGNRVSYPKKPKFEVGETIFVKESFIEHDNKILFRASHQRLVTYLLGSQRWKPAQHMKQEHSRLTLKIKSVKVERLQDVSKEDCLKEGLWWDIENHFASSWNSTHKKPEEKWEANPFVFCFSYEVVR